MYKNIKFLLWVYVEICFTSINSTISTHAVGTVWCGVNPAAVRHHNAAADQRRCSLQSAGCRLHADTKMWRPPAARANPGRSSKESFKLLAVARLEPHRGTAALQHCSTAARCHAYSGVPAAGAGDTGHGTTSPHLNQV